MITDTILAIEGTPQGKTLAMVLALVSAFLHALFSALQKNKAADPFILRGAMDAVYGLIALPFAVFVVPWPDPWIWLLLAVSWTIHVAFKLFQGQALTVGAYSVVYPISRGTSSVVIILMAFLLFGETFNPGQWGGVVVLLLGMFGLSAVNMAAQTFDRRQLMIALGLAVMTGVAVATYTVFDAYGIRASADPFTFLMWFFVVDAWFMPLLALRRWNRLTVKPPVRPIVSRGLIGGVVAMVSFGAIMMATRLDKVGEAAILRETSAVFAALIGWALLKETIGPIRAGCMALIALGAVIVEFAG